MVNKFKKHVKSKEDLQDIFHLYSKQSWLLDKEDSFLELYLLCETVNHKKLIIQLLEEFHYLNKKVLDNYLNLIADYIITDSGFSQEKCQVAAITYDDEADSSQKVLDYIKMPLFQQGWNNLKTSNRFGVIPSNFRKGKTQIILIDEFIGSGKTILGRIKQLKNDIKDDFDLKICFIAGMEYAIQHVESQGFEVFCPLRLSKGISERFYNKELEESINNMLFLEAKLASSINDFSLETYSFGYNKAEALYSLEDCLGNTPNSVFPIFWWPRFLNYKERQTLLTRFEVGLK